MSNGAPDITVLTVTKRYGGIDLAMSRLALQRHYFSGTVEWVLVDELYAQRHEALKAKLKELTFPYPVLHLPVIGYPDKRSVTICRADNIGYANAQGSLVVVLQDYITVDQDGLRRFWDATAITGGKMLITGHSTRKAGHPITDPTGLLSTYDHWCTHPIDGETVYTESRPVPATPLAPITSEAWESNWASVPRVVIEQLKGVDEDYDLGPASYNNQNLSQRAELLGYQTTLDPENPCVGADHYTYFDDRHGARVIPNKSNLFRHNQRMFDIRMRLEPLVKQDYLAPWRQMRTGYEWYRP